MTIAHFIAMAAALALIFAGGASGQTKDSAWPETAPPKLALLVYQRFPLDKAAASGKALAAAARACANLEAPTSWIAMDSSPPGSRKREPQPRGPCRLHPRSEEQT